MKKLYRAIVEVTLLYEKVNYLRKDTKQEFKETLFSNNPYFYSYVEKEEDCIKEVKSSIKYNIGDRYKYFDKTQSLNSYNCIKWCKIIDIKPIILTDNARATFEVLKKELFADSLIEYIVDKKLDYESLLKGEM